MEPITNSPIKENMRIKNEQEANNIERQINTELRSHIKKGISEDTIGAITGFTSFILLGAIVVNLFVGSSIVGLIKIIAIIICPLALCLLFNRYITYYNKSIQENADAQIRKAHSDADRKTVQEIEAYDKEMNMYSQKMLNNAKDLEPMVDQNIKMFQRMISHADAGSNMRFIETDFTYKVLPTGITYQYQSQYTNPQDDFNFSKQRFRDLSKETECEGLALALTKLTMKKMKSLYPPNSLKITAGHEDAKVTMHFKAANPNFVPAKDIY